MSQPNVILILMDDLGWRDLSCYGSSFYETPNLDRLAAEGMRFTDAYASCPVCSPTRASVLTGKYPATVGITNWIAGNPWGKLMGVPYLHALPKSEVTIAEAMKQGGYRTFHVGKWHLGPEGNWPKDFGFDVNVAGCHWGHPHHGYFSPWGIATLPDGPKGEYLTDCITDEAVKLVKQESDRPFYMYLAHYAVHTPIQAPPELVKKYEEKARRLGLDKVKTHELGGYFPCLHKKDLRIENRLVQSDPVYAAMMENLDTNIGKLLNALEVAGKKDNTIVIFTSDNGGVAMSEGSPTCNLPLATGKGWTYDGGVREPLLVRWPGKIKPGSTCSVPVTSTDFYPTLLAAAGLPARPRQHVDGVSILPLLQGKAELDREAIYWHYPHYSNQGNTPSCAMRAGDWKLIEFFETGKIELYNLRDDVGEATDLAGQMPDRVRTMHAKLVAWRKSVEAKIPQPNPDYEAMLAGTKPCPDGNGNFK